MIGAVAALAIEAIGMWVVMQPGTPGRHRGDRSEHAPRFRHHGHHTRRAVAS